MPKTDVLDLATDCRKLRLVVGILFVLVAIPSLAIVLVEDGTPTVDVTLGPGASAIERRAYTMLADHFRALTGIPPNLRTATDATRGPQTIAIGTPESHPLIAALVRRRVLRLDGLGGEGYEIRLIDEGGDASIVVGANAPRGALYGTLALIEALIAEQTGMYPVDLEFQVPRTRALRLERLAERSRPFYPVRATLDKEDPDDLVRYRLNVSGAEGVWSGTGIDDGLGAAFQYVLGFPQFQDVPRENRLATIERLRERTRALRERGIDSYLFMYVTGEPTKALIAARPDLLGPPVVDRAARNGSFYRPFCWSNPEVLALFRDLAQMIVRTYPDLSGFHLRAWGNETRASDSPECGNHSPEGQVLLWRIVETVVEAAREVRPDFKLILSGYDERWLRDPDRKYMQRLPKETIILQKWGVDGEPVRDPRIPLDLLQDAADAGHRLVILSHDVEEVQPLWMVESALFASGVARYARNPAIRGLGGFTVQGQIGFGKMDRRVSARMNWDPRLDLLGFLGNAFANRYGENVAPHLVEAVLRNGETLADFFADYGGILTVTGKYRRGSAYFATRLWDLFGEKAIRDLLDLPDFETASYALRRMNELAPAQERATQAMRRAALLIDRRDDQDFRDAVRLMEMWRNYFNSRRSIVEAVVIGYTKPDVATIRRKLDASAQAIRDIRTELDRIVVYLPLIQATSAETKRLLLDRVDAELALLETVDPTSLVRPIEEGKSAYHEEPEERPFDVEGFIAAPNPLGADGTFFVYTLTADADSFVIDLYTASGRRIRRIEDCPTNVGYHEVYWDGRDAEGRAVANGVYFYRVTARQGEETRRFVGRLAVLR